MASRNLGFEKERNLEESQDDRQILNNLGGGNIQLDIALFRNNLRNTSELDWQYNTLSSSIASNKFIFPTSVFFVYTNGDTVKVTGNSLGSLNANTTYYVVDLELGVGTTRSQLAFGLSTTLGGSRVALGTITSNVKFIRNDAVSKDNILNLATPSILNNNSSLEGDTFSYNIGTSFTDGFGTIETNTDYFNFIRREKYASNDSVSTGRRIALEGSHQIEDPANYNNSQVRLDTENSPGIYITDPFSNPLDIQKTRAFSTSANPWTEASGKLQTKSTQVNIGDLYFSNGIKFDSVDGVGTDSGLATSFTHKIPVVIDGIEYFILLKS
jgi:hypothetical protein